MRTGLVVIALAIPLTAVLTAGTTAVVLNGSRSPAPPPPATGGPAVPPNPPRPVMANHVAPPPQPLPVPPAETAPVATDRPREVTAATAIDYAKLNEGIARATEALDSFNRKLLMMMVANETTDGVNQTTDGGAAASSPDDTEVNP